MKAVFPKADNKLFQGILVGMAAALSAFLLWIPGWLTPFEGKTWDWRVRWLARPGSFTDEIRLILLDQNSLDWAKAENALTWPWPREVYAVIVDFCQRAGAKALAFDVLFTEPSKYGVADDAAFRASVSKFGRTAAAVFLGQNTGSLRQWPEESMSSGFELNGLRQWMNQNPVQGIHFSRATFPVSELAKSISVLSNVNLNPDPDGMYRRTKLFSVFDEKVLPALGLGVYLAANPNARMGIVSSTLMIDDKKVFLDRQGNAVLRYRGPSGTHKNYSAAAILQSEIRIRSEETFGFINPADFKNKYVFFGFSAPGLFDLRSSPVDGVYPGVEIHATILDNFLSGDFMRTASTGITVVTVLVLTVMCGMLLTVFSNPAGSITIGGFCFIIPILLSILAYIKGIWLHLVVQEVGVFSAIIYALSVNYVTEGRQKRFIKNAFGQYLSPMVIEQLIRHPEQLKLGGERRVLSIFFSDLQGFTSISENLDPESLTALLNDYLSAMTDIIMVEGGTIDKYEGDAIIAFWNAPLEVTDHAVKIVRASLRCQSRLAELRSAFRARIGRDLMMRIGINTGTAVVGNMGSHERFDYTMLGDAVNLAARLEGANKQFGTYTMISHFTREMMGDAFPVRELARLAVVGRKEPVMVYEPMFFEDYEAKRDILEVFSEGLDLYYRGRLKAAIDRFSSIQNLDPAAAAYEKKCRELKNVSQESWDGIWVMSTK